MRVETHVHTKYSKDSLLSFRFLLWKLKRSNINAVAITEHNNISGGVEFKKYCQKHNSNIQVIVGEEIFTSEGEIIGLYLKQQIPPGLSPEETISNIKAQGGVVYVPHPYDTKRFKTVLKEEAISRNRNAIDCIEIHNGRNISSQFDLRQKAIAEKYGIREVIGSDAHTYMEVGRNYMICPEIDLSIPDNFLKTLGNFQLHKEPCIKSAHYITKFAKAIKMIKSGETHEVFRIVTKKIKKRKH